MFIIYKLNISSQIQEYLLEKGSTSEQEVAAKIVLQILDILLKSEHSINNEQVWYTFFIQFTFAFFREIKFRKYFICLGSF